MSSLEAFVCLNCRERFLVEGSLPLQGPCWRLHGGLLRRAVRKDGLICFVDEGVFMYTKRTV